MQTIVAIFVLGGIILPFLFKVFGKAEEKVTNVADAIDPDSILGKIAGVFAILLSLAFIIFLAYLVY